jgi:Ca2+-binding RTX toxin-like protein
MCLKILVGEARTEVARFSLVAGPVEDLRKEGLVRRAVLLLTAMMATLLLASGVALAAALTGTDGPDAIAGTVDDDSITGLGGNDLLAGDPSLFGAGGDDVLSGGSGNDEVSGTLGRDAVSGGEGRDIVDDGLLFDDSSDRISGGVGDDIMDAFNDPAVSDVVACGPGNDLAYTDGTDLIAGDCEEIIRGPHPDAWDRSPFQPAPLGR